MKKILMMLVLISSTTFAQQRELNVLTDRTDFHLRTVALDFEKETGIKVNLTLINKGIIEKAQSGSFDIMISKDSSEIIAAKSVRMLQPISQDVLGGIPVDFKDSDSKWFLMSHRIRAFHVSKTTKDIPATYEDLAKPQYKGRICIRPLTDNYNLELFGTLLSDMGEAKFTTWFKGFKDNLARNPIGNDRAQVEGVYRGVCDVAIANTYYRGIMLEDPEQKKWAEATTLYIPNQTKDSVGAIVLYAGVGVLSVNQNNEKFLSYLVRDDIQKEISKHNYEYPIFPKNTSQASQQYGAEQGLNYLSIKIHPNIQNDLFEFRKKAYLIIKVN